MGTIWPILLILPILVLVLVAFQLAYVLRYRRHFLRRCCSPPSVNVDRSIVLPSRIASGDSSAVGSTPSPSKELTLYYLFLHSKAAPLEDAPPASPSAAASTVHRDTSKRVMVQEKDEAAPEAEEVSLPPPPPPPKEDEEEEEVEERSSLYYTPPASPTARSEPSAALNGRLRWKDAAGASVGENMS